MVDSRALVFSDAERRSRTDHTFGDGDVAVAPSVGAYLPIAALSEASGGSRCADRVVLGLGFGAPFAITADWDDRGFQRFNSRNQSLFVLELAPTLAVRLSERLAIGATLDWVAFHKLRIDAFLGDGFVGEAASFASGGAVPGLATIDGADDGDLSLRTDDSSELGVGSFASDFGSAGYTLGALYRALPGLSFGLAYREETPVVFEGDVRLNLASGATFAALPAQSRSGWRLPLEMPRHLQGGFAWDVPGGFASWSVDVQWTQWSAARGLGDRARVSLTPGLVALPAAFARRCCRPIPARARRPATPSARSTSTTTCATRSPVRTGLRAARRSSGRRAARLRLRPERGRRRATSTRSASRRTATGPRRGIAYHAEAASAAGVQLVAGFQAAVYERRRVGSGESRNLGGLATYQDADGDFATLAFTANRDPFAASRATGARSRARSRVQRLPVGRRGLQDPGELLRRIDRVTARACPHSIARHSTSPSSVGPRHPFWR